MPRIIIDSFQGGQANDKNKGIPGAFWNAKNIEYRKNSQFVELNKAPQTLFDVTNDTPRALTFWNNGATIQSSVCAFTASGTYTNAGKTMNHGALSAIECNGTKYMIGAGAIRSFTNATTSSSVVSFVNSASYRPVINFYGDLIIGNGNSVARLIESTSTLIEYNPALTQAVIGGLDGDVRAITQIGPNVYVWCNNGVDTNLYLWDGVSGKPSQKISYKDSPVRGATLVGNTHIWRTEKSQRSVKEVYIGESLAPQLIVKSAYPKYPLEDYKDEEDNKLCITGFYDPIESIGDIVYLPGIGRVFGFGRYFPGDNWSINNEFDFGGNGGVTAMTAGGVTAGGVDVGGILVFSGQQNILSGNHRIFMVDMGQNGDSINNNYATEGFIESMEFVASSYVKGENDKKYLMSFELPHSSCSIEVWEKRNRGTYSIVKTVAHADYPGYQVAEIRSEGNWRTKQIKFILKTTNALYSPKLYVNFINETESAGTMTK